MALVVFDKVDQDPLADGDCKVSPIVLNDKQLTSIEPGEKYHLVKVTAGNETHLVVSTLPTMLDEFESAAAETVHHKIAIAPTHIINASVNYMETLCTSKIELDALFQRQETLNTAVLQWRKWFRPHF